jgi:N-6 DNA methylase
VDMLDDIPMADRDTSGDLYEYLLSKIATAGVNGQFRTPRHIIKLMVDMTAPQPSDEICDPACGTAGFLVAAAEYVREQHPGVLTDATQRKHFHASMFHGYDFDATMLRIGSMNMLLHGIESPDIRYRDSLSEGASGDTEKYLRADIGRGLNNLLVFGAGQGDVVPAFTLLPVAHHVDGIHQRDTLAGGDVADAVILEGVVIRDGPIEFVADGFGSAGVVRRGFGDRGGHSAQDDRRDGADDEALHERAFDHGWQP